MTDYYEAAKALAWDTLPGFTQDVYLERAAKAAAAELATAAQVEVVAEAIWLSDEMGSWDESGPDAAAYRVNAEAAITAYLSTVPKPEGKATVQGGRVSYGLI